MIKNISRIRTSLYAVLLMALMLLAIKPVEAQLIKANTRYAYSCDGNLIDNDDWGATPFAIAMAHAFGVQKNCVHFDYNNKITRSNGDWDKRMEKFTLEGAKRFGFPEGIFFNDLKDLKGAIANFKKVAEASSADDPLIILAAGPMEVLYRCLKEVAVDKRKFLTFVSHSTVNNKRVIPPAMTHDWNDLKALPGGARFVQISDQNDLMGKSAAGKWDPLKSMSADYQWLYTTQTAKPGDVSDAGMMWYGLTGDQRGTPAQVIAKFKNPTAPVTTSIVPLNPMVSRNLLVMRMGNSNFFQVPGANREDGGKFVSINGVQISIPK